jgi:hypothetical protein
MRSTRAPPTSDHLFRKFIVDLVYHFDILLVFRGLKSISDKLLVIFVLAGRFWPLGSCVERVEEVVVVVIVCIYDSSFL